VGGASLRELVAECGTNSLFAERRLVLLRRGDGTLFPQGAADEAASDAFARLLDHPDPALRLALECEGSHGQFALGKRLAGTAHVIPCPAVRRARDATEFLADQADHEGKALAREAADLLVQAHGTSLGTLASELGKLVAYAGDAPAITAADVATFLTGSIEFDIFGLTNAVEDADLPRALQYTGRILHIGTRDAQGRRTDTDASAHRALAMLGSTLENLLVARIALAGGADESELASRLRISPYRAKHLARAAGRHSVQHLRQALRSLADEIHATHDSGGDPALSLLRAATAACGHRRATAGIGS
jgi:DNA polymerase III delta subunit